MEINRKFLLISTVCEALMSEKLQGDGFTVSFGRRNIFVGGFSIFGTSMRRTSERSALYLCA